MPFYPPFNLPFFYGNYRYSQNPVNPNVQNPNNKKSNSSNFESVKKNSESKQKASEHYEASEAFFEIFGLKLYFDDILIMCILFFLYNEKVHNDELFICLILLLLTWL